MVDHNRFPQAWRIPSRQRRGSNRKPVETLAEAIELEPQIGILLDQAKREIDPYWDTYERYKQQLMKLAGWYATNPRMATEHVYGLVIDALTDALDL